MYANMLVEIDGEQHSAWKVEIGKRGKVTIFLDDPEDEGSYAAPIGKLNATGKKVTISADF